MSHHWSNRCAEPAERRNRREIAALVPLMDFRLLEKFEEEAEDRFDAQEAEKALHDPGNRVRIPWEKIKNELDVDVTITPGGRGQFDVVVDRAFDVGQAAGGFDGQARSGGVDAASHSADEVSNPRQPECLAVRRELLGHAGELLGEAWFEGEGDAEAGDADAVLGFCTPEIVTAGKKLRWIQVGHAGVEKDLVPELMKSTIVLTNMQRLHGPNVADQAMALLLNLTRGPIRSGQGKWEDLRSAGSNAVELHGKSMLIVGLGGVGTQIANVPSLHLYAAHGFHEIAGRADGVEIRLSDPTVSHFHVELSVGAQGVEVTDLGSHNGTYVNGQQLPKNGRQQLGPSDIVGVGHSTFRLVGDRLEERFSLTNPFLLPATWITLQDHSTLPDHYASVATGVDGSSTSQWTVKTRCTRRGVYTLGGTTLETGDPLGIYSVTFEDRTSSSLAVMPPIVSLPAFQILPSGWSGEGRPRRHALQETINASHTREMQPNDPLRLIHWKTTARQGDYFVRQSEGTPASTVDGIREGHFDERIGCRRVSGHRIEKDVCLRSSFLEQLPDAKHEFDGVHERCLA